jgi:hypothetical protein
MHIGMSQDIQQEVCKSNSRIGESGTYLLPICGIDTDTDTFHQDFILLGSIVSLHCLDLLRLVRVHPQCFVRHTLMFERLKLVVWEITRIWFWNPIIQDKRYEVGRFQCH